MPHQIIEYSANLEPALDIDGLIAVLHETAGGIEAFPVAGLRTRAGKRERYRVADNHPDNAFVHVVLRIAHGRPLEVQKAAGDQIFAALCDYLAPIQEQGPLAISFEIQEIDPERRWKKNNLRDYLTQRAAG